MKRLTLLTIIVFIMVLAGPAMVISGPPGPVENPPPNGWNVNINNQPVEVTGDVNATVTGDVNVANTPDVNVVNTNPVPVTVQNEGELVFIRNGYTVPDGKTLKIVDISVRCVLLRPSYFTGSTEDLPLNVTTGPFLSIWYPDPNKCLEPVGMDNICPFQYYSLGPATGYSVFGSDPDTDRKMVRVNAGRQTNIIALQGALLSAGCAGAGIDWAYGGIDMGQGYLY